MNKRQRDKFEQKHKIKTFKKLKLAVYQDYGFGYLWDCKAKTLRLTEDILHRQFMSSVHVYSDNEKFLRVIKEKYLKDIENTRNVPSKVLGCRLYRKQSRKK